MDKQREAFEKLPEVADSLSEHIYFAGNKYNSALFNFQSLVDWLNGAWYAWQQAQKVAVPEGFILVEESKLESFYQDDDEPENFCSNINEIDVLGENLDIGDIIVINKITSAHIETKKFYGMKVNCNQDESNDKKTALKIFNSYSDAHKAMIEAGEKND